MSSRTTRTVAPVADLIASLSEIIEHLATDGLAARQLRWPCVEEMLRDVLMRVVQLRWVIVHCVLPPDTLDDYAA